MTLRIFYIAIVTFPSIAHSGAWVADKGQTKMSLSHFDHQNILRLPNIGAQQKLRDQYSGVLLEYGATNAMTLTAKTSHSRFQSGPRSTRVANNETQLGLMFNASKLASGLLPPYLFRLTKSTLPKLKLHREKRASLHIGVAWRDDAQNEKASRFTSIAMADKVSAGHFHVMQEIESRETRHTYGRARNGYYRFSLGYHAWQIGSQAEQFQDERTGFVSLTHSYRVRYKPPHSGFEITIGRGYRRIGQAFYLPAKIFRGRVWSLEVQRRF